MEGHLSVATIETLHKILRTCRNMRHVIAASPLQGKLLAGSEYHAKPSVS